MKRRIRSWAAVCVGVALPLGFACGGSGSSDGSTSETDGTQSTDAGGSGGEGATNASGGDGGTGTTDGASSTTGGGDAGTGGMGASVGGNGGDATSGPTTTDGMGGTAGNGGSAGATTTTGGGAGSAGASGAVGTLGDPCDSPGALACAGNNQKLTVVCGGDGTWATNQTCGETEFCDSTPGANAGICRAPSTECVERSAEEPFCLDGDVQTCGSDGLAPALAEDCVAGCLDGACVDDSCPTGDLVINCDEACGEPHENCAIRLVQIEQIELGQTAIFRTPPVGGTGTSCDSSAALYDVSFVNPGPRTVRIRTSGAWRVFSERNLIFTCIFETATSCIVETDFPSPFWLVTEDLNAGPANITIEYVAEGATCDE